MPARRLLRPLALLAAATSAAAGRAPPCLCVFDVERTLTGKPGELAQCRQNQVQFGIVDSEASGAQLTLANLALRIDTTFCASCFLGLVSTSSLGGAGSAQRGQILAQVGKDPKRLPNITWSACENVTSPLATSCQASEKRGAVAGILAWYQDHGNATISPQDVHFFDDSSDVVASFKDSPYNARQVSCGRRDGFAGLCGAAAEEVVATKGTALCSDAGQGQGQGGAAPASQENPCLCVFDIDRTLTGKQGETNSCPNNRVQVGVVDNAYGRGPLTLSVLAQQLERTFCAKCFVGTISTGSAAGPDSAERRVLTDCLKKAILPTTQWSTPGCDKVNSPLVTGCTDGLKQVATAGILAWYKDHMQVTFAPEQVYLFDDRRSNVVPFQGLAYSARQVACGQRDGQVGLCGAVTEEIVQATGVSLCFNELQTDPERMLPILP